MLILIRTSPRLRHGLTFFDFAQSLHKFFFNIGNPSGALPDQKHVLLFFFYLDQIRAILLYTFQSQLVKRNQAASCDKLLVYGGSKNQLSLLDTGWKSTVVCFPSLPFWATLTSNRPPVFKYDLCTKIHRLFGNWRPSFARRRRSPNTIRCLDAIKMRAGYAERRDGNCYNCEEGGGGAH